MPVFHKRLPYPIGKYKTFKNSIRIDFRKCCGYCLMPEIIMGGAESFELDHHKPQVDFHELIDDYGNIFYSCRACNKSKWCHWPKPALLKLGRRYIDFTKEDFGLHFEELDSGEWKPLTSAAEYTLEKIDLNRKGLVELRKNIRDKSTKISKKPIDWQNIDSQHIEDLLFKVH